LHLIGGKEVQLDLKKRVIAGLIFLKRKGDE
jgi:hypothetical protein